MPADDFLRARHGVAVVRVDVHGAVVLDVDLRAGLGDDAFDGLAAGADDEADLLRIDLDGLDARRVFAQFLARRGDRGVHDGEDFSMRASRASMDRFLHDVEADAGELQVELEAGDALCPCRRA